MQTFSFPYRESKPVDKIEISAQCKCGYKEVCQDKIGAEVLADRHESRFIGRRAYMHDADAFVEVR